MIPGRWLYRLASALCSAKIRARAVDALLADFQHEWNEAPSGPRRVRVVIRWWMSFWIALAECLVYDAQHDCAGFRARVLTPIARYSVPFCVSMVAPLAPSWVRTGHVDWFDAARGFAWMGWFTTAILIANYRSRHAQRRALTPFFLAVGAALAIMVFHPVNDDRRDLKGWLTMMSLTMAWPFLVRKAQGPAEARHYR